MGGHRDAGAFSLNETDCNDEVFKAALRLRLEAADKQTSDLFLQAPRNASYLGWRVQNQIISLMGDAIKKQILSDISQCKYFSILADETTDVSQKEQLRLVYPFGLSKIPKCTKNFCALFQFLQQQTKILHLRFSPNYLSLGLIWNICVAKVMMAQVQRWATATLLIASLPLFVKFIAALLHPLLNKNISELSLPLFATAPFAALQKLFGVVLLT